MWNIIKGTAPIFYINYTGTDYQLIDGLTYQMGGGLTPLRITEIIQNGTTNIPVLLRVLKAVYHRS
ncbi:MAG: hypothetical protein IPF68_15370 [Bacteroidales bacterium]|nr:hypothetical protein [Bacteroidales bacterium]